MEQQTVLVIDDDAAIRDIVATLLTEEGYAVITAGSGEEALSHLEVVIPSLIITDMRMPVMDGWQFAAELHRRRDGEIPLLVMTAAVDAQQRAAEVDADDTISKPFDLDEFVASVKRLIGPAGRDPRVEVRQRNQDS